MHKIIIQKKIKFKKQKLKKCNFVENDETDGYQQPSQIKRLKIFDYHEHETCVKKIIFDSSPHVSFLSEIELWYLVELNGNLENWKFSGKLLNLSDQELLVIESKYLAKDCLKECFYQMLLKWRLKEPENCYLEYLCKKLEINVNKFISFKNSADTDDDLSKQRFQSYFNRYFHKLENIDEIFFKLKNFKLIEKILWHASGYLFQEWKSIARSLLITENDIYLIDTKYYLKDGIRECCYQMLIKWRELYPNSCYFYNLSLKLIKINFNFYVCQLLEYFSQNILLF